jgi:SulP family sulfate permease
VDRPTGSNACSAFVRCCRWSSIATRRVAELDQTEARTVTSARDRRWGCDVVAGLTAVALLAPECIAYARIAGVPPQYVLSAAPVGLAVYVVIGRSVSLIVGATAATTVISAAVVSGLATSPGERAGLIAALAVVSGVILLVIGVARGRFVARFLTEEAITGFLAALALVIFVRQFGSMVGVEVGGASFFVSGWHVASQFSQWSMLSLIVGLVALLGLVVLERYVRRIPATLVVLIAAWFVSTRCRLHAHGVAVVGKVPGTLPTVMAPSLPAHSWGRLLYGAFGLALVTLVMSYSVVRLVAGEGAPPLNGNRELVGVGGANVLAGLFGGLAVGGSPSASSAAHAAGARTRLTGATAVLGFLVVAKFLTPAFAALPVPVIAAVVIVAVRHLIAPTVFRRYLSRDHRSFVVAIAAVAGVLVFNLIPGLLLAVALSLLIFVATSSRLQVSELGQVPGTSNYVAVERHPEVQRHTGLLILRPNGDVFYANVGRLTEEIEGVIARSAVTPSVLLLDLASTLRLDLSTLDGLLALREAMEVRGVTLWFAHLYLKALDATAGSELSDVPRFDAVGDAVSAFDASLNRE